MFMIGLAVGLLTGITLVFAVAFLAYRTAQQHNLQDDDYAAINVPLERAPRCGDTIPGTFGGTLGPCILAHGHGGMHEEADSMVEGVFGPIPGARWTPDAADHLT